MLVQIEGQIVGAKTFIPQGDSKKKAHHLVSILQTTGEDAEIISIRDYNLKRSYQMGQTFKSLCHLREWSFQGKAGVTVIVVDGQLLSSSVHAADPDGCAAVLAPEEFE